MNDMDDQSAPGSVAPKRLTREERTIAAMVGLYCRDHHAADLRREADGACAECAELLAYARLRLARCRYGADKPACAKCPTHCYKPAMRERVREVMRYSGPRMLRTHPVLALAHVADGRRGIRRGSGRGAEAAGGAGAAAGPTAAESAADREPPAG